MFQKAVVTLVILHVLGGSVLAAGAGGTEVFSCVPLEVAVLDNRAHVLCAEPIVKYRGGYPRDDGYPVMYFAVPLSDVD